MEKYIAGKYVNQGTYKCFQPEFINRAWTIDNMELITLLGQADRQLGRLDMCSEYIPNIDLFMHMHIAKEATTSSRIEGTRTGIEDAILDEEDINVERRSDWKEVQRYILALNSALEEMRALPLSSRLIRTVHKVLLTGTRGEHKQPGSFRISQNWIGGATLNDAVFIPPPYPLINEFMSDIERFAHNSFLHFPELLKIALIHYQFETVHPFLDGNGRVGRMMITLYLIEKGILKRPVLYLSDYFEKNRNLYYDNLMKVREKNDILQWFRFFLSGVIETATHGISTFNGILKLQKDIDARIQALGSRTKRTANIISHLYLKPIIDARQIMKINDISAPSAYKLIDELEKLDILREITGGQRGKKYVFGDYLDLFK